MVYPARTGIVLLVAGCAVATSAEPERVMLASVVMGDPTVISAGDPSVAEEGCRSVGGGWLETSDGVRVAEGHSLHPVGHLASRLHVTWGRGHHFQLDELETVQCEDDPTVAATDARFDTFVGTGTGQLDQAQGSIFFRFTDGGRDGMRDHADLVVYDAAGAVVLDVSARLLAGDHRSW